MFPATCCIIINNLFLSSRYVFWSDFGSKPRIERANLDGQNRLAIVSSGLKWPNDLAVDFAANRLYWIDAYRDKVESVDFSGGGRRIHTDVSYYGRIQMHPYGMALFAQHSLVYFTDWYRSIILYQPTNIPTTIPSIAANGPQLQKQIGQVRILHSSNQPPGMFCVLYF